MTALKQAVFVAADGYSEEGVPLVRVHGANPGDDIRVACFSNICRTTTGVAYPRHRPKYFPWSAVLRLEVNGHLLSAEAAVNLVSLAGQFCGLGEWRPTSPKSTTGDFGRFEVKLTE